jgi:hypothetical protein
MLLTHAPCITSSCILRPPRCGVRRFGRGPRAAALRRVRARAVPGRGGARPAAEPAHGDATAGQDPRGRCQDIARRQQPRDKSVLSGAVDMQSDLLRPHLLSTMDDTYRERDGEAIYRFRGCPREGGRRHAAERLFAPQHRLKLPGGRHRHSPTPILPSPACGSLAGKGQGGGVDNMMWGSDYPHPWPGCRTTNRPSLPRTRLSRPPCALGPKIAAFS